MPADMKPTTLEEIKKQEELVAKAKAGKLIDKPNAPAKRKTCVSSMFLWMTATISWKSPKKVVLRK
jgi:hypothetical protein